MTGKRIKKHYSSSQKKYSETIKKKSLLKSKKNSRQEAPDNEEMARKILRAHFAKISLKDRVQDLLDRISVEAALQDQFVRISVEGPAQEILRRFPSSLNNSLRVYIMHNNAPYASCEHNKCSRRAWGEGLRGAVAS